MRVGAGTETIGDWEDGVDRMDVYNAANFSKLSVS